MRCTEEDNKVYAEERKLLNKLENIKEKKEILYFIKDFKVAATNNQIERDLKPIKIKQKIGKSSSKREAEFYAKIHSCINTQL